MVTPLRRWLYQALMHLSQVSGARRQAYNYYDALRVSRSVPVEQVPSPVSWSRLACTPLWGGFTCACRLDRAYFAAAPAELTASSPERHLMVQEICSALHRHCDSVSHEDLALSDLVDRLVTTFEDMEAIARRNYDSGRTATLHPVNLNTVPIIHDDNDDGADDLDRLGEVQEDAYDGSDDAAGEDVSDDSGPHEMHTPRVLKAEKQQIAKCMTLRMPCSKSLYTRCGPAGVRLWPALPRRIELPKKCLLCSPPSLEEI
ncbi:hypothetical protein DL767_002187 [Monosporascus sp. MG133]|nr:hypothetical protein DL767_002187 [Monosporascus sp. MG133]